MRFRSTAQVHAPGPPTFELHTLGWKAFQDLCVAVFREVWGQAVQPFADSHDGGRDGAFQGIWTQASDAPGQLNGRFVIQCKFLSSPNSTLTLTSVKEELSKIARLVSLGICDTYVLITNARITATSEETIRQAILAQGTSQAQVFSGLWLSQTIAANTRLRMLVPRVYGLGDLSQILDERAYAQARVLCDYLANDLATFVVTDAYRKAAAAITNQGFCFLLGDPGVGKSAIAATLAVAAIDQWQCLTVRANAPEDLLSHWNPNEPRQFFWIDDAFGAVRFDEALARDWGNRLPEIMAAVHRGARIAITSRRYIYEAARPFLKQYRYPLFVNQQISVEVGELSRDERRQILYNHVRLGDQPRAVKELLRPHLAAAADGTVFYPETARRLGNQAFTRNMAISSTSVRRFLGEPVGYLEDVYKELGPDEIAALALVYQEGQLPVPLNAVDHGREALLRLVGAEERRVAPALDTLEGTFLRRSGQPGSVDLQEYWTFRHPTLREGFAAYLAQSPRLIPALIRGLDDDKVLTQLDCGSEDGRGTLVRVPETLYEDVAVRVAGARTSGGDEGLQRRHQRWASFLSRRCSKRFLEIYLRVDPGAVDRCVGFGSYMSVAPEVAVLRRLAQFGLLSNDARDQVVRRIGDLAVETPDADWLEAGLVQGLLQGSDIASIWSRVREELVPRLQDVLDGWEFIDPDGDPDEFFRPLEEALRRYLGELSHEPVARAGLEGALARVDTLRSEAFDLVADRAAFHDEEDLHEMASDAEGSTIGLASTSGQRDVFDDVHL